MYEIKSSKIKTFDFKLDGEAYSVPLLRHMPLKKLLSYNKQLRHVKAGTEGDFYLTFIADVFDENAPGVTDRLTTDQFASLMQAYIAESNVSPGESSASSD